MWKCMGKKNRLMQLIEGFLSAALACLVLATALQIPAMGAIGKTSCCGNGSGSNCSIWYDWPCGGLNGCFSGCCTSCNCPSAPPGCGL